MLKKRGRIAKLSSHNQLTKQVYEQDWLIRTYMSVQQAQVCLFSLSFVSPFSGCLFFFLSFSYVHSYMFIIYHKHTVPSNICWRVVKSDGWSCFPPSSHHPILYPHLCLLPLARVLSPSHTHPHNFLCAGMPLPRHLLASSLFSSVQQARASDDYQPGFSSSPPSVYVLSLSLSHTHKLSGNSQWRIGYSSLLLSSLGLVPFKGVACVFLDFFCFLFFPFVLYLISSFLCWLLQKDNFWTTEVCTYLYISFSFLFSSFLLYLHTSTGSRRLSPDLSLLQRTQ